MQNLVTQSVSRLLIDYNRKKRQYPEELVGDFQ